ncbi:MAG: AAA family ATPase [Longimicrobiales bacterium]|nr:AAA family ATPase [Longimicrobiales bacterium]
MSQPPPEVRVQLFSEPLLGRSAAGDPRLSPYQAALLALVFAEESISRPRVAAVLWTGREEARARHGIRQLKSEIRRRAGVPLLEAEGDLLIASAGVQSDVRELDFHLTAGRLQDASRLVAPGITLRDLDTLPEGFLDWSDAFVAGLRGRIVRAARAKWKVSLAKGDWSAARDAAEALYIMTPEDDEVVVGVIEARARVGRLQAAEVAYAEYRDRKPRRERSELVEETIRRVRELGKRDPPGGSERRAPFVGRKDALSTLVRIFDDVRAGTFSFALVSGEAGIGKTRLIREVERAARIEGFRCMSAEPVELERRIPLNPIIDALADIDLAPHLDAVGEPWRTVVGTMLPPGPHAESVQSLPPIDQKNLSRRLLDAFSLLFRSISNERPTLFFLDDLQWADATTIAALQFYQRRWNESYFGVVATVRPAEVGRKDPAKSYLSGDGKLNVLDVPLKELETDEARKLVGLLGEGRIDDGEVSKLCALSGGHPLYLTELTRDFLSGRLVLPASEADAFNIPISLRQILRSRMEGLDEGARAVLNLLAVSSRPMRLSDLGEVLRLSLDRTADAADELRLHQLVEVDRDRIWIAHELFRAGIYRELSEPRRAVLHMRLAAHIEKGSGEESASELAIHLERAGQAELAAKYGWTAAGRAFERGAVDEAAHFYELVTRNEEDEPRRAEATALLATSLHLNRDMSRANPALELASTRLRSVGMTEYARRMDIRRVEGLAEAGDTPVNELVERLTSIKNESREAGDWEGVALALDAELGLLQRADQLEAVRSLYSEFAEVLDFGDPVARAIAHQGLAVGLMLEDPRAALASAQKAVSLTKGLSRGPRLTALNRLLIVLLQQGRLHLQPNHRFVEQARELASRSGDLLQRFSFESNVGVSFMDAGQLDLAEFHFERASSLLGEADMTFPRINLAFNKGELALARRDFPGAAEYYASAREHEGLAIPRYTHQLIHAGLGLCALEMGQVIEARQHHEALRSEPPSYHYDPTVVLLFRAKFLARRGNLNDAILLLRHAQEDLEGRLVTGWLKTQLTLARLMKKGEDAEARVVATRGLEVADQLKLSIRKAEFGYILSSLERQ